MKTPIKIEIKIWNSIPETEVKKDVVIPRKIGVESKQWNSIPETEVKKDVVIPRKIGVESKQWNSIPETEVKKDVAVSRKIGVEPKQWSSIPETEVKKDVVIPRKIGVETAKWSEIPETEINKDVATPRKVTFEVTEWGELPEEEIKNDIIRMTEPVNSKPGQWGELSGLQEPSVIRKFDGINELNSFAIKDEHATRTKNLTPSRYPALTSRNGGAVVASTITAEIDGMAVRGTELHVIAAGSWYKLLNGTWTTLKTGLSVANKWSFVNFQGGFTTNSLLATNGVDVALKYDGTSVTTLANAPSLADFITTHDNRVYLAVKSTVHFSALRKAEDWSTVNDSGSIVVETSDGLNITGLVAGSARLTVFKQNSIHELFGNNPGNYQMKITTDNLGSPTGNSAQVIDGVIYFLGNDAIYRYSGGSLPSSDFSIQARGTLSKMNKAAAKQCVSWQIGKRYYLAIPTGVNTNPDTVLEYDLEFNTWNIWSFPSPITAKGAILSSITYVGSANGTIYKLDNSATTDNGAAIQWEWVSKPFTFNSLAAKSRWYRMWIVADIPTGATLNVHVSGDEDGENWTKVQGIVASTNIQSKEIMIPTTLINNSHWVRIRLEGTGQAVVYEISRQERVFPFGQN